VKIAESKKKYRSRIMLLLTLDNNALNNDLSNGLTYTVLQQCILWLKETKQQLIDHVVNTDYT